MSPHERLTRPDGDYEPTREEVDEVVAGLEAQVNRATNKQDNAERDVDPTRLAFYEKAKEKAESILARLDPRVMVSIDRVKVMPDDKAVKPYYSLALSFEDPKEPRMAWTMEIEENAHYIDHDLEGVIRSIHDRIRTDRE